MNAPEDVTWQRLQQVEGLIAQIEQEADAKTLATTRVLVQALLDLHKEGLSKIIDAVNSETPPLMQKLADDDYISSLLLLHDLHPTTLSSRLTEGLKNWNAKLSEEGARVDVLGVKDGHVELAVQIARDHNLPQVRELVQQLIDTTIPDAASVNIVQRSFQAKTTLPVIES